MSCSGILIGKAGTRIAFTKLRESDLADFRLDAEIWIAAADGWTYWPFLVNVQIVALMPTRSATIWPSRVQAADTTSLLPSPGR